MRRFIMTVQNLAAGAVKDVAAGEITGNVHVYRTNDGYNTAGNVGWVPTGGALQQQALAVGETATFNVAGASGMIANGCPSRVQLLWNNQNALGTVGERRGAASGVLRQGQALSKALDNSATQALSTLNSQWYNAVVKGCGLDPSTFQLVQGSQPLGTTSEEIWKIADVVPPMSVTNFYNPSQANVFSSDYGAVVANLKPQNDTAFQSIMGDYYNNWMTYLGTNPTMPQGGILALFQNWAAMHLSPGTAQAAYTAYQQVSQGTVPVAVQLWLAAGGGTGGVKAYNGTMAQLQYELPGALPKSFSMNSATESSDVSNTWAETEVGGIFDIFEGAGESSYSDLSTILATSTFNISATFNKVLTFPLAPLARPSSDPILSQYQPWYSSPALNLAYQHQDNTVWKNTPPTWADTFGPEGNMLRTASALVIVDGVTITMSSSATFSAAQQQEMQTAVEAGIWPFFEAEGSGGWSNKPSFSDQGAVTITCSSPAGNPVILGVIVTPIDALLLT
jgi:hypothetical protein